MIIIIWLSLVWIISGFSSLETVFISASKGYNSIVEKDDRLEIFFLKMPYVAGDDHQSQLIFARLYSKYRVRIQDSCLAGSCSSCNNNLPHYIFWRCLMFSKSRIPWTYAPVETLYGQISARGASLPKQGQAWKKHRVGPLLLPVTSGLVLVPCGCLTSQAQVSTAMSPSSPALWTATMAIFS